MIHKLLAALTDIELKTLTVRIAESEGQLYRFIDVILQNPKWEQSRIQQHFGINSNTYFKNISLAKDEIYEVIKLHMRNSYDELILSNVLYRRGLDVNANKLRLKLEDDYSKQGWWNVLHELYGMEMMVAYTKCDVKRMEEIKEKSIFNMERLCKFNKVDREVIVQMGIIEKGDMKEKDFAAYAKTLAAILKEAEEVDHPIPLFNALHCLFVFYTQYEVDIDKAKATVKKADNCLDRYENRGMVVYARNVALLNSMGFHIEFATGLSADQNFKKVKDALGRHGMLFDTQAWVDFCVYHFFEKNKAEFDVSYKQFCTLPLDSSLQYQAYYLGCLNAYLHGNRADFYNYLNSFYSVERSRAHNGYDLFIRYMELLVLIKEENFDLASDKLEAAVKFTRRNFTSYRIQIEKQHWDLLKAAMQGKIAKKTQKKVYRMTDFILNELKRKEHLILS